MLSNYPMIIFFLSLLNHSSIEKEHGALSCLQRKHALPFDLKGLSSSLPESHANSLVTKVYTNKSKDSRGRLGHFISSKNCP